MVGVQSIDAPWYAGISALVPWVEVPNNEKIYLASSTTNEPQE
jgi:hypothetical protein